MNGKEEQETGQPKRPYRKPELSKVPLRPEEAVLGFCKTSGSRGPVRANCGTPIRCYGRGS
jgi:hypothetical protein